MEKLQKSNVSFISLVITTPTAIVREYLLFYLPRVSRSFTAGEVPVTKLAALQKVLQSDFLSSVREVYEHVYETVDIQGSQVCIVLRPDD